MSVADDLQGLADLAEAAAHKALSAQIGLGPRPAGPDTAVLLWDQTSTHLQGQIDSLTALASKLSADAVLNALAGKADDLAQISAVTDRANAAIEHIDDVSKLFTTIGHFIDVGVAVLALAAAPSPTTAQALFEKGKTLAGDL
jgi:hypothetical protein